MKKALTVIGFLGSSLDQPRGRGAERFSFWRPTVSIFQHEDLLVSTLELLVDKKFMPLAKLVAEDIRLLSPETTVNLIELGFDDAWDLQEVYEKLYDWVRAYPFDPEHQEYLVHLTTGTHIAQICWFLLTEAHYLPGRLLQTSPPLGRGRGASSRSGYEIIDLDLSKYDRLSTRLAKEHEETLDFLKSGIPTKNKHFNQLITQIERVATSSDAPILLTGPTGAGKSMLAGRIYELSKTRAGLTGKFVEVNCATLRGDQAMSALFGHKRGAFTGAQTDRPGLLKEADKGLIFLDEIGELGADEQAMLLRALEDKTFLPLGSDKSVSSNFQLIAGTNKDLRAEVATGRFREDLLARINLWTFTLPGLSERREDIAANVDYELERFTKTKRHQVRFNKEARDKFLKFSHSTEAKWCANFRDLNAAVIRLATLAPQGRITEDCVSNEITRLKNSWERPSESRKPASLGKTPALSDIERSHFDPFDLVQLDYVVDVCRASKSLSEAGRSLFAISRAARANTNDADRLKKYLARFGLSWAALSKVVTES